MGNTGSVHDALVLRRSPMYKEYLYPPAGYALLGDGGYPCLRHPVTIIMPYRHPLAGRVEERFNQHHTRARNVVERAFGMLKTRWRAIFLRALEIRAVFAPKVVTACCILHNLCLATGDIPEEEHHEDDGGGGVSGKQHNRKHYRALQCQPSCQTGCTDVRSQQRAACTFSLDM
ncbi:putative nuclease HARBI1 [Xyrichtys novacula]|uniref:Nuclease HARBI1 n=1 Tax=Xyrichtys novacula TaxID=13765 RepID=A0AAV1FJ92_XYRNO|nr:putative nuclease HARBI1 [Xyrichtys novacula]